MSRSCPRLFLKVDHIAPSILVLVAQLSWIIVELLVHIFVRTLFIKPITLVFHLISVLGTGYLAQHVISRITAHLIITDGIIYKLLINELLHLTINIIAVSSMMISLNIFMATIVSQQPLHLVAINATHLATHRLR